MIAREALLKAKRVLVRKGLWHWLRFVCLLGIGFYLGHELQESSRLTDLRYWLYRQQLYLTSRAPVSPRRTALVLLDDEDYWSAEFAGRAPLNRDRLAEILDRLREAGVNTVALDVDLRSPYSDHPDFDFPQYRQEDAALMAAIGRMCDAGRNVVLGTIVSYGHGAYTEMPSIYSSSSRNFGCLHRGYIHPPYDLRIIPGQVTLSDGATMDSFALATIAIVNPTAYREVVTKPERGFRFARFLSEEDFRARDGQTFVFNWAALKKADLNTVRRDLADRTVLVGGHWHSVAFGQGPEVDRFNSPAGPIAGTLLHANYIEALDGERGSFAPLSDAAAESIEFLMVILLAVVDALDIHAIWKWGAFLSCCAISVALTYVLLENLGIFLDFLVPFLILIGHTMVEKFMTMRDELHHLKQSAARIAQ
jgi:hypothetical protein